MQLRAKLGFFLAVALVFVLRPAMAGIAPNEVAVVANSQSVVSQNVAQYYCQQRGIPLTNIIYIPTITDETISLTDFQQQIWIPLENGLRAAFGPQPPLDPYTYDSDFAGDSIKALVMCYGMPSGIQLSSGRASVDSYLTLLFNDYGITRYSVSNPYLNKQVDFAMFRASTDNDVAYYDQQWQLQHGKMRYLVCRLDGLPDDVNPQDGLPDLVKTMIDKSVRAKAGGNFVVDGPTDNYPFDYAPTRDNLLPIVGTDHVIYDRSSVFLTGQQDIVGYIGEHAGQDSDNYTSMTRPLNSWHDGGVALTTTNDGQSYRSLQYFWGTARNDSLRQSGVLIVDGIGASAGSFPTNQYAGFQAVLYSDTGGELARTTFAQRNPDMYGNWHSSAVIDLTTVSFPASLGN